MPSTSALRVKQHRESLRAKGLRPIQFWLPDTRDPKFIAECRRQSRSLMDDPAEKEILDWMEKIADTSGWT